MAPDGRVVIIGAGFGGLSAAKALVKAGVPVTLVDKRNHHLFQPLLYQVATAALSPAEIAVPIRSVLSPGGGKPIEILMEEVSGVDTARKVVHTHGGDEIAYGQLIVATGSQYTYFGKDEEWAPFAPSLKSIDDAVAIRRRVLLAFERAETTHDLELRQRLMTFVIIGGGPTGVETAGAMAELAKATLACDFTNIDPRSARVILVEAGPTLLSGYPPHLGEYTVKRLHDLGVEVLTDSPVDHIDEHGVVAGQTTIETSNIFWCAGVKATAVGQWLGVPTNKNGTVTVGSDLRVPGLPDVFVIGDAARVMDEDNNPLPALAPVAKQQGQHAARVIMAARNNHPAPGPFRYRDWGTMATIGRSAAVGKFGKLEVTGFPAWVLWGAVHVAYLVGFRNRVTVLINWLWHWLTYAKGSRLITGPQDASVSSVDSRKAIDDELDKSVANLEAR